MLSIDISWYLSILIAATLSIGVVILYAYRYKINNILTFILLFFGSLGFTYTVDYVFNNVLQIHQQKRILDLLGLESDLSHWGYNVNQSKIAIGSGGFSGKGFLEGTQTKFNFVPEQSTDFIFCTVGEEWGFIGSAIVIILFVILILRLIRMGERQQEPFGRIYLLLRGFGVPVPHYDQHRHDDWNHAGYRHPAPVLQLRRIVAHRIYDPAVCRH